MKIVYKVLEIIFLVGSMFYILNAAVQFEPELAPDVSLGWACLYMLLALYNKENIS